MIRKLIAHHQRIWKIRKKPPGKILSGKIYLELLETVSAGLLNIGLQCGNAAHHLGFLTIHYD